MNIVFFGTPDFSIFVLESLINSKHNVIAVVTQEDKLVGRKQVLTKSPVKLMAEKYNINVLQFHKIREEGYEILKTLNADIFITCAYGQIISEEILNLPKYKTINVHFSILPKYRGASPVQWALINGEETIGVTIMKTDVGIDTGDIIVSKTLKVLKEDNTETLLNKLSELSVPLLLETLDNFENNNIKFIAQGDNFSYYPILKKEDGKIDFNKTSKEIVNLIKGLYIWPNAYCFLEDKMLKIFNAEETVFLGEDNFKNGEIIVADKSGLIVKCNNSYLKILELQIAGGKRLDYKSFINGNKFLLNKVLN